jgi:TRAP-type C4-dicarboxylate transport system permease small subunit
MRTVTNIVWKCIELTALTAFSIMLILVIAQVVFRYLLQISVPWTEEAARWIYAWQVFLGSTIAMRERLHLRLTLLVDRFAGRPRALLECCAAALSLCFFGGIVWGSLAMIRAVSAVDAGSFRLSMSYLYLSIPIGLVGILFLTGRDVLTFLAAFVRPRASEG